MDARRTGDLEEVAAGGWGGGAFGHGERPLLVGRHSAPTAARCQRTADLGSNGVALIALVDDVLTAAGPTPHHFSITDFSGSSQKAQTAAPKTSSAAATMKGACQEPYWTRTPKTIGDNAPPMFPAMFITPDTVPEYWPPTCMGTDQEGPMVNSRQNSAAVRQKTAV